MPLEGHWARQQAPFRPSVRRESWALAVAGGLVAAIVLVVCWALIAGSAPSPAPGCRHKTVATSTGGATIELCDGTQSTDR